MCWARATVIKLKIKGGIVAHALHQTPRVSLVVKLTGNTMFKSLNKLARFSAKLLVVAPIAIGLSFDAYAAKTSALSEESLPFLSEDDLPARRAPLLEIGNKFLSTGNIRPGFEIPTGAIWQPNFWVYGNFRSGIQRNEVDEQSTTEWSNRLDLFGNLQLTGTERVVIGLEPLHEGRSFSGRILSPSDEEEGVDEFNLDIRTLFFEGDIAELFPKWDVLDSKPNDFGFSIGRQNVQFQSGMILNDTFDAFGISKNSIRFPGVEWLVNMRTTFIYGWDNINRDDNEEDEDADLYGAFIQMDTYNRTLEFDFAYVDSDQSDVLVASIDSIQTINKLSSTFRVAGSHSMGEETRNSGDGVLLFGEVAWTPPYSYDNIYVSGFAAFDNYVSAARGPTNGGALGQAGILFAGRAVGSFPSALSSRTSDVYGMAFGRQFFFSNNRKQLILESGVRSEDFEGGTDSYAVGARYQQAFGGRTVLQLDGFVSDSEDGDTNTGIRLELQIKI